ncbi:MAG: FHA domain-containing protein [Planctomycetota bacterium]
MTVGHFKIFFSEDREDKVYPLYEEKEYIIGRARDADIQLNDIKVSRVHSKVVVKDNRYFITDNNSRNCTYVNGEKIETRELVDGDQVRIGFSVLQFFMAEKGTHVVEVPKEQEICALCNKAICQGDIISGRAEEARGKHYCPDCLKKLDSEPDEKTPEKVDIDAIDDDLIEILEEPEVAPQGEQKENKPSNLGDLLLDDKELLDEM